MKNEPDQRNKIQTNSLVQASPAAEHCGGAILVVVEKHTWGVLAAIPGARPWPRHRLPWSLVEPVGTAHWSEDGGLVLPAMPAATHHA